MRVPIPLWRSRRVDRKPATHPRDREPHGLDADHARHDRRARPGASFTLLIPPDHGHQDDWSQELALELVGRATGGDVASLDSGDDPLDTVHRAVSDGEFDELIVCTAPSHLARWVHHDLPHRLEHLGLPVLVIPPEPDAPIPDPVRDDAEHRAHPADTRRRR